MRVTSKGQVTIPKDVRERLGIQPGSDVGFAEEGGKVVLTNEDHSKNETPGERMVRLMVEFGDRMRREGKLSGMTRMSGAAVGAASEEAEAPAR